jgi:hypothetical protein
MRPVIANPKSDGEIADVGQRARRMFTHDHDALQVQVDRMLENNICIQLE